ncbi:MAG TPA: condensation domain-containing protein, partial [Longimicrobiaceae bacterium]|nr:condensation domain-containing protein [Longimicrobiaceae bacterium]
LAEPPVGGPGTAALGGPADAVGLRLPPGSVEALRALARTEGGALTMVLLACFKAVLHRCLGRRAPLVLLPVAGRDAPETREAVGDFVNLLPLRADCAGDPTFRELFRRVRERTLEAYAHQELPYLEMWRAAHPECDPDRIVARPEAVFNYHNSVRSAPALGDLRLRVVGEVGTGMASDGLTLNLWDTPGEALTGSLVYRGDLFDPDTIREMAERFEALLESAASDPDRRISAQDR